MTKWLARSDIANPIDLGPIRPWAVRENGLEQDAAAGDRNARRLTRPDGTTTLATVRLRQRGGIGSRQVTAILRWTSTGGERSEHWIGALAVKTRSAGLSAAWEQVRERSLLTPEGRCADA